MNDRIKKKPLMPLCGSVFSLTWDFKTAPEHLSIWMGERYEKIFHGECMEGLYTSNFVWIKGPAWWPPRNFYDIQSFLKQCGNIPSGQWIEAILENFEPSPWHGIAHTAWHRDDRNSSYNGYFPDEGPQQFPSLDHCGEPRFFCTCDGDRLGSDWHWLVDVSDIVKQQSKLTMLPECRFCSKSATICFETSGSESQSAKYTRTCFAHIDNALWQAEKCDVHGDRRVLYRNIVTDTDWQSLRQYGLR